MTSQQFDFLRNPFGDEKPQAPQPPDLPSTGPEVEDSLDFGAIEQDVFLLKAYLLNSD